MCIYQKKKLKRISNGWQFSLSDIRDTFQTSAFTYTDFRHTDTHTHTHIQTSTIAPNQGRVAMRHTPCTHWHPLIRHHRHTDITSKSWHRPQTHRHHRHFGLGALGLGALGLHGALGLWCLGPGALVPWCLGHLVPWCLGITYCTH